MHYVQPTRYSRVDEGPCCACTWFLAELASSLLAAAALCNQEITRQYVDTYTAAPMAGWGADGS